MFILEKSRSLVDSDVQTPSTLCSNSPQTLQQKKKVQPAKVMLRRTRTLQKELSAKDGKN